MDKYCIQVINEIMANIDAFNNVDNSYKSYLKELKKYDFSSIKDNNILSHALEQLNYINNSIVNNAILGTPANVFEVDLSL